MTTQLTLAQCRAIRRKWQQGEREPRSYRQMLSDAQPTSFGAVVLQWAGMWLCIERDGHTHT